MADESKKPESKKKSDYDPSRRTNAPKALGLALGRLTRPMTRSRGAALGEIIQRWAEIAGPLLKNETQPEKLSYASGAGHAATLEIGVSPAFALELQHLSPLIIEKINGYFGYRAVDRLKLKQMPIRHPESPQKLSRATRPLTPDERVQLEKMLDGVEDKTLRQALETLGRSLLGASR